MRHPTIHPQHQRPPTRPAGWRSRTWDYTGAASYLITLTLVDRRQPCLGSLVIDSTERDPQHIAAHIRLTPIGQCLQDIWATIPAYHPEINVLACQVMPDHFHGVLWVNRPLKKPLSAILRGVKSAFTHACLERFGVAAETIRFIPGFHDVILSHRVAVQRACNYVIDNPRRAAIKRSKRDLFQHVQCLAVPFPSQTPNTPPRIGHFQALGNRFLLDKPHFYQVQVSRRDFQFEPRVKGATGPRKIALKTAAYDAKKQALIHAAQHGAVIVSPCISDGERALCRFAIELGCPVIYLKNQGFSPYFKPHGQLFEWCASGNVLLLVPAAWPYTPAKKALTRQDALVLNRIAQWICGADAATINYKGLQPTTIDPLVKQALTPHP